jgi:hypothetical protein
MANNSDLEFSGLSARSRPKVAAFIPALEHVNQNFVIGESVNVDMALGENWLIRKPLIEIFKKAMDDWNGEVSSVASFSPAQYPKLLHNVDNLCSRNPPLSTFHNTESLLRVNRTSATRLEWEDQRSFCPPRQTSSTNFSTLAFPSCPSMWSRLQEQVPP